MVYAKNNWINSLLSSVQKMSEVDLKKNPCNAIVKTVKINLQNNW